MARVPEKSPMMQSGVAYLQERYPGLVDDCIEYKHEREANGMEYVTVKLVVGKRKRPADG